MQLNLKVGPLLKWGLIGLAMFIFGQVVFQLSGGLGSDFSFFMILTSILGFLLMVVTAAIRFSREAFPPSEEELARKRRMAERGY